MISANLPVLALLAVLVEGSAPCPLRQGADRLSHRLGEIEADREADVAFAGPVEEVVAGPGRVDPKQDLDLLDPIARDLLKRRLGDRDLIGGGVGAGVARPQHPRGGLARLVEVGEQRMEAVAALEVAGRSLLLGMGADEGRVEVDRHPLGRDAEAPGVLAGLLAGVAERLEELGLAGDPLDHPIGRRIRGDLAEERRLVAHRAEVCERIAAVGEHHRQVADDPARVVAARALAHRREPA